MQLNGLLIGFVFCYQVNKVIGMFLCLYVTWCNLYQYSIYFTVIDS